MDILEEWDHGKHKLGLLCRKQSSHKQQYLQNLTLHHLMCHIVSSKQEFCIYHSS